VSNPRQGGGTPSCRRSTLRRHARTFDDRVIAGVEFYIVHLAERKEITIGDPGTEMIIQRSRATDALPTLSN
jgi:hypothetical protein